MSAKEVLDLLEKKGLKLAIAESLTGGMLCSELVSVAGASNVVLGSVVAYQTDLKSWLKEFDLDFHFKCCSQQTRF